MAKFERILWFKFKDAEPPVGKGIGVVQDDVGWFYLFKLLKTEGVSTPFGSIQEIEIYVGKELEKIGETPISENNR